jgi:hypothetical protein
LDALCPCAGADSSSAARDGPRFWVVHCSLSVCSPSLACGLVSRFDEPGPGGWCGLGQSVTRPAILHSAHPGPSLCSRTLLTRSAATAGYEATSRFSPNYNLTDNDHWFSKFIPGRTGNLCQPA